MSWCKQIECGLNKLKRLIWWLTNCTRGQNSSITLSVCVSITMINVQFGRAQVAKSPTTAACCAMRWMKRKHEKGVVLCAAVVCAINAKECSNYIVIIWSAHRLRRWNVWSKWSARRDVNISARFIAQPWSNWCISPAKVKLTTVSLSNLDTIAGKHFPNLDALWWLHW